MEEDVSKVETQNSSVQKPKTFTFFGSYDHSLDPKGRIIVPMAYRKSLGDVFTISITRDGKGIGLYPNEVFDELFADVFRLNQRRKSVVTYQNTMAKYSFRDVEVDSQGRVLLPQKLRQALLGEETKDVEISGAIDHIRIVSSKVAQEEESFFFGNRDAILDEIADMLDE